MGPGVHSLRTGLVGVGWVFASREAAAEPLGTALYFIKTGIKSGVTEMLVLAAPVCTALEKQLCGSFILLPFPPSA